MQKKLTRVNENPSYNLKNLNSLAVLHHCSLMATATSLSSSALAYSSLLRNSSTPLSITTRKSLHSRLVVAECFLPNSSTPLSNTMRTKPSSSDSTEMLRDYLDRDYLDCLEFGSPVYPNESVFKKKKIYVPCCDKYFVEGGRYMFNLLPGAFEGIKQIGVLGYDSQVTAHARHLRDSLAAVKSDIVIKVGLRKCSHTFPVAREAGFTEQNGTLGDICETIAGSDLVLFLNSDATDADDYKEVLSHMKPNSILGLSHQFLPRDLESMGLEFPKNISVIAVYPRETHPSLRKLWVQGEEYIFKTKLNSSFRVLQDIDGRGTDVAIGWSIALGSPFTFAATLEPMLHGRSSAKNGESDTDAYNMFEHRTGITSKCTSKEDLLALYYSMEDNVDNPTAFGGASYNFGMGNSYGCSVSWSSRYTEKGKSAYKSIFEYTTGIVSKTALMVILALSISLTGVGKAAACSASYYPCIDNLYDVAAGSFFAVRHFYKSLLLASPMVITNLTRWLKRWLKYVTFQWNWKFVLNFGRAVGPPPPYRLIAACAFALGVFSTLTLMMGLRWFCHHHSYDTMLAGSTTKRGRGRPKTMKKVSSKNQQSLRLLAEMTKKQEVVSEDS